MKEKIKSIMRKRLDISEEMLEEIYLEIKEETTNNIYEILSEKLGLEKTKEDYYTDKETKEELYKRNELGFIPLIF